jgi:hypothetical protein
MPPRSKHTVSTPHPERGVHEIVRTTRRHPTQQVTLTLPSACPGTSPVPRHSRAVPRGAVCADIPRLGGRRGIRPLSGYPRSASRVEAGGRIRAAVQCSVDSRSARIVKRGPSAHGAASARQGKRACRPLRSLGHPQLNASTPLRSRQLVVRRNSTPSIGSDSAHPIICSLRHSIKLGEPCNSPTTRTAEIFFADSEVPCQRRAASALGWSLAPRRRRLGRLAA